MPPSDEGSSKVCMISRPSCLTLCDPIDCSPPGYSVHGILWARKLKWVAMSGCIHLSLWADSNLCMKKKEPHSPDRYLMFNLMIWWITQTSQWYKVTLRGYLDIWAITGNINEDSASALHFQLYRVTLSYKQRSFRLKIQFFISGPVDSTLPSVRFTMMTSKHPTMIMFPPCQNHQVKNESVNQPNVWSTPYQTIT